jgi:CRISPR-associated endonuclease/helicase Cas3
MKILAAVRSAAAGRSVESTLQMVAERLARLSATPEQPLRVIRLRGGVYRDEGWAADPLTPSIIISTVDQIGSRLLFRGYGVGRRSLAREAGLLAFDTQMIIDEAHLSNIFAETVDAVRRFQGWAEQSPLPPSRLLRITRMSATTMRSGRSFELCTTERQEQRLAPRLEAPKCAELVEVPVETITKQMRQTQSAKARGLEQENQRTLIEALVHYAKEIAAHNGRRNDLAKPRVIGIVVNRVATARAVYENLHGREDARECEAILLTGRIRPFDRDRLVAKWLPKIRAGRQGEPERPLFVVATQTVEVGANIDFDALVTEAAPLDALRQRFGRLDRLGRRHQQQVPSPACILSRSDYVRKSDEDPIYGSAISETWKWLTSPRVAISSGKRRAKERTVDFGVTALDKKLQTTSQDISSMLAPQNDTPLLLPAHLNAWVQTDPVPEPDPDVAPFLHGRADTPADVQVVWRADLSEDNEEHWSDIVALMPPRTREAMPIPVHAVCAWLAQTEESELADVEGGVEPSVRRSGRHPRNALRWRGIGDSRPINPNSIRPGDTIVVPVNYGGADACGWNPSLKRAVEDVADVSLAEVIASYPAGAFRRPKLRIRLHPKLLPDVNESVRERWEVLLDRTIAAVSSNGEGVWPLAQRLLREMRHHIRSPYGVAAIEAFLQAEKSPAVAMYPDRAGLVVSGALQVSLMVSNASESETEYEEPEDDEASFSLGGRPVLLSTHCSSVGKTAREFASKCCLSGELIDALDQSGFWHDQGKRDPRFQAWLHGSELKALAAHARGQFLAKSGRDLKQWQSSETFGYPAGSRHEFASVRLFEQIGASSGADYDLMRFLIGTHHGRGRPFPPVLHDPDPVEIKLTYRGKCVSISSDHSLYRLDSGWVDLFWKMVRSYGWWGIAYLEAVIIAADRTVSAFEQRRTGVGSNQEPATAQT